MDNDHLAACDSCTVYVDQVRELLRVTAAVGPDRQLPEQAMAALSARFQQRRLLPPNH